MSRPSTTLSHGERPSQTPRRTGSTSPTGRVPGRKIALAASFLALPVLLSGCSTEWASMSPSIGAKQPAAVEAVANRTAATSTPTATATATPSSPAPRVAGELAGGSVQHKQQVGADSLVLSYWTDGTSTDIHMSAVLKGADRDHAVKVTRFAATLDSSDGSTSTEVPLADDQGEFVLTPPYSYTTALALPESTTTPGSTTTSSTPEATGTPGTATKTTKTESLAVRFDLLLETAPGSGAFYRQTVLDTVALTSADASEGASK